MLSQTQRFGTWERRDISEQYKDFCKKTVPQSLEGLHLVLDCAHGATSHIAPGLFLEMGASITNIAADPNGFNINDGCGATQTALLQKKVIEMKADLGIAFDGDGDRVIMIDHRGNRLDGDDLLYIIAHYRHHHKPSLSTDVVGTIMSNASLEHALDRNLGLSLRRAQVGDRSVYQRLRQHDALLGGEPAGHIILRDRMNTGDGLLVAFEVLAALAWSKKASHPIPALEKYPQIIFNIPIGPAFSLAQSDVQQAIGQAEQTLGACARLLVRLSGTEPVIRVMLEGAHQEQITRIGQSLVQQLSDINTTCCVD